MNLCVLGVSVVNNWNRFMNIEKKISEKTIEALQSLYSNTVEKVTLEKTNPDFVGDITLVVFNFLKISKKKPEETAYEIGNYLKSNVAEVSDFNVVKGFLNIVIEDSFWLNYFSSINDKPFINPSLPPNAPTVMVEYSSPNTNKPLHLGHVRNNLLGFSVSEILKAAGNNVIKTNLVNDRGIHICKSMLAWKKWGGGETPESSGLKGDHLVGKYYVKFDLEYKKEYKEVEVLAEYVYKHNISFIESRNLSEIVRANTLVSILSIIKIKYLIPKNTTGISTEAESQLSEMSIDKWFEKYGLSLNPDFNKTIRKYMQDIYIECENTIKNKDKNNEIKDWVFEKIRTSAPILEDTQDMLRKWESGDKETRELWEMMNAWVYKGFDATYKMLGVSFDKTYYESNTYLLGKNIIDAGLATGVLKHRVDKSVYIDLTAHGLDEKTLLRADGTSVYMTQDLGTALQRFEEYKFDKLVYTVGNEQDYHFKVLFLILKKMGYVWADGLFHLSYGMVELPAGKMKSREGTVVDADELMQEMIATAAATTKELGKTEALSDSDAEILYRTIGLGALKYFILKVDPKKKMLFNPAESIDFNGNTAPFIQFNYVRIQALLRKAKEELNEMFDKLDIAVEIPSDNLLPKEKALIIQLYNFNSILNQAANEYSPAVIANYVYDLAKEYSQYYHDTPIFKEEKKDLILFRLQLSKTIGDAIRSSMKLLGIEVPERM